MKLRNKKTGEIIDIYKGQITLHYDQGRKTIHFKSLEELEDWEDYEEPHEPYRLTTFGEVVEFSEGGLSNKYKRMCVDIGNYFETKEEAERAVEKLKAWKRLKDKGFVWQGWEEGSLNNGMCVVGCQIQIPGKNWEIDAVKDLDLLFGGEG